MIDILWLLVCSGFVFLMQPGFMCLESGFTRSKNSINVAVKNLADFGISAILFWAFGYALMFGASQAGWIGSTGFALNLSTAPALASFFVFQTMFCSSATTIVSGAVAERLRFGSYLLIAALTSGLIYPVFGHWAWNREPFGPLSGWLAQIGFVDFAGSTVVHGVGGWISLATLFVVGPRLGRFPKDGPPQDIRASNLPMSVLGVMLLWLGWLGFNGGSTFALNEQVPHIIVNTVLAGAAGMIAAAGIGWQRHKLPKVEWLINGSLAGLVAINASCNNVTTPVAVLIGGIAAVVMLGVVYLLKHFRIDDAVDAVAVHAGAGVWGTLALGIFGELDLLGTGLDRLSQIGVQLLGIVIAFMWSFGLSWVLLTLINRFYPLRVSPEEEEIGLNVSEHNARTETFDLLQVMEQQAKTKDLSLRAPVNPFTEVGPIALRYNQAMAALEETISSNRAIIRTAGDAIVTFTTATLEIISCNPSTEAIFGYKTSELIGMPITKLIGWDNVRLSDKATLLRRLLDVGAKEAIGHKANGSIFPLEATMTLAELGDRSFYTCTFRDITERKQAEEALREKQKNEKLERTLDELRQTQTQLIQSEKMSSLGQMVAGVAHEINNPINFIYGNLIYAKNYTQDLIDIIHLYQEQFPPTECIKAKIEDVELEFLQEDLPKLQDSLLLGADRIREIVQSLRIFSRVDEAEVKEVNIHDGIESTLLILRHRLQYTKWDKKREKKNLGEGEKKSQRPAIEVIKEYGDLPLIECYAGQLNQVFMNLLSNAIDALEEAWDKGHFSKTQAKPTIQIRTKCVGSAWLVIKISDNGVGIKPDTHKKLFDPFFTTKAVGKGTGLGLSISYQIVVERHGGRMWCQSEPGQGAEFIIEIPLHQNIDKKLVEVQESA